MIGDNINDIKSMLCDITRKLTKIQEENDENIKTIVNYSCSTELNVGGTLCRYGELYKLIFKSTNYDEVIQKLEKMYKEERFEGYEDVITTLQNKFIFGLKHELDFELGSKMDALNILEHEYIFDTILNCL